jgi:1-deoxy-D-xylulose-5-phosphate reductoisomerase
VSDRTRVAVLGSTGSIGRQALDVLAAHADRFEIVALAAGRDVETLNAQIAAHRPRWVTIADELVRASLEMPAATSLLGGHQALEEIAASDGVDLVLVGTTGVTSLRPVIAALQAGKVVATANKETLVSAGHLVVPLARRLAEQAGGDGATIALAYLRPIDSEHSAIWQCLAGERREDVARLILTASGGPFREWPAERMATVTPSAALAHPTWRMGAKITVDSATLMNKALEVIEARWLYDVGYDQVDVVVHPQSIVHSLVEFADGSLKAQLGLPDMRIPIQYALTYPAHLHSPVPRLDATDLPALTFESVDEQRFPALAVGREAGRRGPRASATLIAADDVAVERFLRGSLDFPGIADLCADATGRFGDGPVPDLNELLDLDAEVRAWAATATPARASGRP